MQGIRATLRSQWCLGLFFFFFHFRFFLTMLRTFKHTRGNSSHKPRNAIRLASFYPRCSSAIILFSDTSLARALQNMWRHQGEHMHCLPTETFRTAFKEHRIRRSLAEIYDQHMEWLTERLSIVIGHRGKHACYAFASRDTKFFFCLLFTHFGRFSTLHKCRWFWREHITGLGFVCFRRERVTWVVVRVLSSRDYSLRHVMWLVVM